jgi:hypothetical protein
MHKPIYSSEEHRTIIEVYMEMCKQFVQDSTTQTRNNNYLEVVDIIIEYSNGYGQGVRENNFYDWIMIIPINLSVATNGFFAGLETRSNAPTIRAYRTVLQEMVFEVADKIDALEPIDD